MSTSRPRPIHTPMRDLRETPDEAEPSYSYEDSAFLGGLVDDVEDEFHRRLASTTRQSGGSYGGGGGGSNSSSAVGGVNGNNTNTNNNGTSNGGSSFWRTDLSSSPATLPLLEPVTVRERKSSGGLLGAALLQSQISNVSSENGTTGNSNDVVGSGRNSKDSERRSVNFSGGTFMSAHRDPYRRSGSSMSQSSTGSNGNLNNGSNATRDKKNISKQRAEARRLKMASQLDSVDIGHLELPSDANASVNGHENGHGDSDVTSTTKDGAESLASNDSDVSKPTRSLSGGGIFYGGKSSGNRSSGGAMFGKSSNLIFPTSGEIQGHDNRDGETTNAKRQKIALLIDQCDAVRFPFKKKLILNAMNLTVADIPMKDLYGTNLGKTLHKLSLAGNRLSTIPPKLATCLPVLKTLDLSQCELHQLPERWNLPQLKRLILSHNRLTDFPEETMLEGLPELQQLDMYGNKVTVIVVPQNPRLLAKLEMLNLGYNDLSYIPDELDRLKSLKTLKVMNNFLEKIPMRVCDMDLKSIDVSSNPVIQPPIETCERGICSMKRYYHCLRMEEQSKQKALEALQSKASRQKKTSKSKKIFNLGKQKMLGLGRKQSDDGSIVGSPTSSRKGLEPSTPQSATTTGTTTPKVEIPETKRSASLDLPVAAPPPAVKRRARSAAYHLESQEDNLVASEKKPIVDAESVVTETQDVCSSVVTTADDLKEEIDDITVNDTLKVIFVGMAMAGKTSMIMRLIEGVDAKIPKRDERTVGVDIYEWDPKDDHRFEHIDSRIELQDKELEALCGDVNVKFSVWDFAGQHVYHATHELFFSPRALYVLVWDMGANNPATKVRKSDYEARGGAFSLNYDSDEDSIDDDYTMEEEVTRADQELKRDIDDKIQFWVDCIQSSAPGAAILPVASFDDLFEHNPQEAKRRCNVLKERLLEHEARRVEGIQARLREYVEQNRANDDAALRLRKLLCPYTRPKLIFGSTENDAVVRVSGKNYTGFANLTERIINIAAGRERANMAHPIFRGHIGARIPRMRLEVRDIVRQMRDRFKVVEWGYFISVLKEKGLTSVEDISDALHFLTNVGELSYFGGVLPDRVDTMTEMNNQFGKDSKQACMNLMGSGDEYSALSEEFENEEDDEIEENALLSIENTSITLPTTDAGSVTTFGDNLNGGLSQFVFLNPRWLVAAVACILRHDLERELHQTRRALDHDRTQLLHGDSFGETNLNCPVITADDACMLWQAKKFTKKAAERVEAYSNDMPMKPFEFLQLLLIRFGVFVPIDLGIEKAFLGGKEYARPLPLEDEKPSEITVDQSNSPIKATFFFLPSLLGPGEPAEAWTYKNTDSWKATLCHSVLFPDGVPPGLMERITAAVLSNIYAIAQRQEIQTMRSFDGSNVATYEGQLTVKEVLCWRTAFFVKIGMKTLGQNTESTVEVFCGLVDKESHLCVGSESMLPGMRRLVSSAKGQEGDGGRKIWKGGYLIVLKAVQKVMDEYGGLEYEKQGFCPECMAKKSVSDAGYWDFTLIRSAIKNGENIMRCKYGHRVDTRLVAGPLDNLQPKLDAGIGRNEEPIVPIHSLLRGVVVVGLWDGKSRKVIRVGSGFIADKKRGLIVTASHTLMNIWGDKSTPFGENYYGLRQGKVVIGVIPRQKDEDSGTEAVFRYFAKIVAKDPFMDSGVCHLDACILKITTRMENDVSGSGEECGDQPEKLLLNNPMALKQERLHQLQMTDKCELDEQVRIVGYNQGGEGLMGAGIELNRYVDFARGYVCKKFAAGEGANEGQLHRFKPREEIVVICPTIGGHSGGPCVNLQGEVIGILSRADPAESQRCYLVPTYEWKALLREAKKAM